jgi:hypothetical protein
LYRLLTTAGIGNRFQTVPHELGTALDGRRWQLTRGRLAEAATQFRPRIVTRPFAGDRFF